MDEKLLGQIIAWWNKLKKNQKEELFAKELVFAKAAPTLQNLKERFRVKPAEVKAAVMAHAGKDGWPQFPVVKEPIAKDKSVKDEPKKNSWLPWFVGAIVVIAVIAWWLLAHGFVKTQIGSTAQAQQQIAQAPVANAPAAAPTVQAIVTQNVGQVSVQQNTVTINPVIIDSSKPGVVQTISGEAPGLKPQWPQGTIQTSNPQAASNEHKRVYHVYQQTNPDEVLAFVAEQVEINGVTYTAPNVGTKDQGAVVGLVLGQSGQNLTITLKNAELKTLTIPGGASAWQEYILQLAKFQSSTRSGASVIIIGAVQ